jgi:dTDP-glucose 4,6-dehydratase
MDKLRPSAAIGQHERLIEFVLDRPGHDFRYALDGSRLARELGWSPRENFEAGLEKTVRWYLDRRDWWAQTRTAVYRGQRLGIGREQAVR